MRDVRRHEHDGQCGQGEHDPLAVVAGRLAQVLGRGDDLDAPQRGGLARALVLVPLGLAQGTCFIPGVGGWGGEEEEEVRKISCGA